MTQHIDACKSALRILFVEDNPGDAELVRIRLAEMKNPLWDVRQVTCLADAMQAVNQARFDVILLDLRLPDANGTEAIEAIRTVASDLPVVVLTQLDDEDLALQCIDLGAQDYLCKDVLHPAALRRAIRFAILRLREAQERLMLLRQLEEALTKVLSGYVTICMHCKQIRVNETWQPVELYVERNSEAKFTHGVCPTCIDLHYPKYANKQRPE